MSQEPTIRRELDEITSRAASVDRSLDQKALAHLDDLTKPKGSLGRLEEAARRIFLIQDGGENGRIAVDPARIYTCAGDHGVAARGVSLYPQEVTRQMVANFLGGGAAINVLAKTSDIDLKIVDAGCAGPDFEPHPDLIRAKVAPGTADFTQGPAMTMDQCLAALLLGAGLARDCAGQGLKAVGTGDMGIANTTPSTALYCACLGLDPKDVTGPGTGLDAEGVARKAVVVAQALEANREALESGDPVRLLAALGGLEIAALAGLIIGAARHRLVVAVDGFISTAAYVAAANICPAVKDYCFFAHASAEPGHAKIMAAIGQIPLLHLDMRLGEGTGSALALFLLRSACNIYNDMSTFSEANVTGG